jgi:hypothetical protein
VGSFEQNLYKLNRFNFRVFRKMSCRENCLPSFFFSRRARPRVFPFSECGLDGFNFRDVPFLPPSTGKTFLSLVPSKGKTFLFFSLSFSLVPVLPERSGSGNVLSGWSGWTGLTFEVSASPFGRAEKFPLFFPTVKISRPFQLQPFGYLRVKNFWRVRGQNFFGSGRVKFLAQIVSDLFLSFFVKTHNRLISARDIYIFSGQFQFSGSKVELAFECVQPGVFFFQIGLDLFFHVNLLFVLYFSLVKSTTIYSVLCL